MQQIPAKHAHKFSIADGDALQVLLNKLGEPNGTRNVDEEKGALLRFPALQPVEPGDQPGLFHGLLTGSAVGLKHK